jgi:hypothetical protein
MHVAGAAGITGEQAVAQVGVAVIFRFEKISSRAGDQNLISALKVLPAVVRIVRLGRQRVESDFFQMIGPGEIAGDGQHGLQGEHPFHNRAQLDSLSGRVAVQRFIAAVHALRLSVITLYIRRACFTACR